MAIAISQHHGLKPFNQSQRCRLQSFTHFDYNILEPNQTNISHYIKHAIDVANIHRSFSTPCFPLATILEEELDSKPRIEIIYGHKAAKMHALIVEVSIAMASNVEPTLVLNGLGGAYLLHNKNGDNIAIAKPIDEELLAFNNLKGFGGLMLGQPDMKRSIKVGGTGIRELAAYLLDHGGFAGVPPTALVKIANVAFNINNDAKTVSPPPYKIASLQRYIAHDFDAGELGSSSFSVASVHQIGIFDVRVLNLDRHAGNILVKKNDQDENYRVGPVELVPIDHGLCLPEWLDDPYFEWLHWPQASIPFSELEFEYISNLDPFKDAEILQTDLPSLKESSIRVLILCTIFLKQATTAGLCLADIGKMMTREFCGGTKKLSILENLCAKVKALIIDKANNGNEEEDCNDIDEGNGDKSEQTREENEEEITIFQVDDDTENDSNSDYLDIPMLLQSPFIISNQTRIQRFSSMSSKPRVQTSIVSPSLEENNHKNSDGNKENYNDKAMILKENGCYNDYNDDNNDGNKVGGLTRSISYLIQNYNCEIEGVSFGDMSKSEWQFFLDCFEELLLKVIEGIKYICPRERLRTYCKF